MPKISELEKKRRREQIIDRARRCFGRYGYERATLPRLEKAIGLTRGGIFHYFENKQALFVAAAAASSERFEEIWAEGGATALLGAVAEEDPAWIAVMIEASVRARTDRSLQRAMAAHREAQQGSAPDRLEPLRAHVRADVPLEQAAIFLTIVANGLALRRATGDAMPDRKVLGQLVASAVGALDQPNA